MESALDVLSRAASIVETNDKREKTRTMSLLEPRMSDLRAGFGRYGYTSAVGMQSNPLLPLWRPTPGPPAYLCTLPSCPCSLSLSRSNLLSDLYDYASYSWYLKAVSAQDQLYKGLPLLSHPLNHAPLEPSHYELREHIDSRSSPGKELSTKLYKLERIKERRELSRPLKYEKDHGLNQEDRPRSVLSSSPLDYYRNGNIEMYRVGQTSYLPNHPAAICSPTLRPAPRYPVVDLPSPHEGPLNLTMGSTSGKYNSSNSSHHSPTEIRPSVITCTSLTDQGKYLAVSSSGQSSPSDNETADVYDPAIEEHFRRSLGKKYPEYLTKQPSLTTLPPPSVHSPQTLVCPPPSRVSLVIAEPDTNINVAGSVDDHFARALGDSTWLALKPKNSILELAMSSSVDDHFAKALGSTWLQLKAEKETTKSHAHSFPLSQPLPHSISHILPNAHSLPHSITQQSSLPESQQNSASPILST